MRMPGSQQRRSLARSGLVFLTALAGIGASYDVSFAGPRRVTSNTRLFLDGTVLDQNTGDSVALAGFIHVQTQAELVDGTVAVRANVTEAFLAYPAAQRPNDPRLDRLEALAARVRDLKQQIAALHGEILDLEQQLQEVQDTDVNPFLPGTQIDEEKAAQLAVALAHASAELERLQSEIKDIQKEMVELLEELQDEAEAFGEYDVSGADARVGSPCLPSLACERFVSFDLVRSDGRRSSIPVLLTLLLSTRGEIVSVAAEISCEAACGPGEDTCLCP